MRLQLACALAQAALRPLLRRAARLALRGGRRRSRAQAQGVLCVPVLRCCCLLLRPALSARPPCKSLGPARTHARTPLGAAARPAVAAQRARRGRRERRDAHAHRLAELAAEQKGLGARRRGARRRQRGGRRRGSTLRRRRRHVSSAGRAREGPPRRVHGRAISSHEPLRNFLERVRACKEVLPTGSLAGCAAGGAAAR